MEFYKSLVHFGEAEAIQLAKELGSDRLLIDDAKAREVAISEGLKILGLLGVVLLAKRQSLIPSAPMLLTDLQTTAGAYFSADLVKTGLKTVGE